MRSDPRAEEGITVRTFNAVIRSSDRRRFYEFSARRVKPNLTVVCVLCVCVWNRESVQMIKTPHWKTIDLKLNETHEMPYLARPEWISWQKQAWKVCNAILRSPLKQKYYLIISHRSAVICGIRTITGVNEWISYVNVQHHQKYNGNETTARRTTRDRVNEKKRRWRWKLVKRGPCRWGGDARVSDNRLWQKNRRECFLFL